MASKLDLTIDQGSDFQRVLTLKDPNGALLDLTGYTFRGQARDSYGKADPPAFSFSFTLRNQVSNKGEVDWSLANSTFSALVLKQSKSFVYDVEMVSGGGIVTRILQGSVTLTPEVTK